MKTSLDHLPVTKQAEIEKIVELILAAGEAEMIILFGSHARGDWVDDFHVEGKNLFDYQSDYDIYVLTRLAKHVDRFSRNEALRRRLAELIPTPVSLIADPVKHFNHALERGRYFYVDVVKEGIVLFDAGRVTLSQPRELSREEQLEEVTLGFETWFESAEGFFDAYLHMLEKGRPKLAAFQLHQVVENLTTTALLVLTSYKPKGHDIAERLRQCAALDRRFAGIFPLESHAGQERFELLREAYIGARYRKDYRVTAADLEILAEQVRALRELVHSCCAARIESLRGILS